MPEYSAPTGAPIWFDLASSDVDRAADFYTALFGWTAEDPADDFGGYRNFLIDGAPVAGLMPADEGQPADVWTVYLHSPDVEDGAARVDAAGGTVLMPATTVGDFGRMAVVTDPAGAAFGLWQPDGHHGFRTRGEVGTPYWFDEMSTDYDASLAFYPKAFDCAVTEITPAADGGGPGRYAQLTFAPGTDGLAGLMDAKGMFGEGHPSFWQVYITVEDTAATLAKAVDLGGTQLSGPDDTPFGVLGAVKDPTGAAICIATPRG